MTTLVLGSTGATGRLLVKQLLAKGEPVKVIVRSIERLPTEIRDHENISITEANVLELSNEALQQQIQGCRAVASCLGHNMTLKGIFGQPRQLVTETVKRICLAIVKTEPKSPVKFILMNTTGNQNRQAAEKVSLVESIVITALRFLVPPHADNELAAAYLQSSYPNSRAIQWSTVRPDSLIDQDSVTPYNIESSPNRSPIFDAGKTSRVNVADFMATLALDEMLWQYWMGRMPVIYND